MRTLQPYIHTISPAPYRTGPHVHATEATHIHTPPITPQGATVFRAADAKRHETTNRSAGACSSVRCKMHKRRYSTTKQQDGATAAGTQSRNETASSCLATAGQRMMCTTALQQKLWRKEKTTTKRRGRCTKWAAAPVLRSGRHNQAPGTAQKLQRRRGLPGRQAENSVRAVLPFTNDKQLQS